MGGFLRALGPFLLLGCGQKATTVVDSPWPNDREVVVMAMQAGHIVPGSPRYVAEGAPLELELEEGVEASIEARALFPRLTLEDDLEGCRLSVGPSHPLDRRVEGAWRSLFVPGDAAPSWGEVAVRTLVPLSTDGTCGDSSAYCDRIQIKTLDPIGTGDFFGIGRFGSGGVVGLVEDDRGDRRFFRYDGQRLHPAPELDPSTTVGRRISTFVSSSEAVRVLYENGELYAIADGTLVERYSDLPGALFLALHEEQLYALGSGNLWRVDSSTVTRIGDAPPNLLRFHIASGDLFFGIDAAGIQVWQGGAWTLEHPLPQLALTDGRFSSDHEIIYVSDTAILHRLDTGEWTTEAAPQRAFLNGGITSGSSTLLYGEAGALHYRPGPTDSWCVLASGTSQSFTEVCQFGAGFALGLGSETGDATMVFVEPPAE